MLPGLLLLILLLLISNLLNVFFHPPMDILVNHYHAYTISEAFLLSSIVLLKPIQWDK
ncbi:hypothetical protein X975_08862, partial [Stegodyphus mimosarum]